MQIFAIKKDKFNKNLSSSKTVRLDNKNSFLKPFNANIIMQSQFMI